MTRETAEWVRKAEGDYSAGWVLLRSRRSPNFDGAAYHAQQSAEKYLKARLIEAGAKFPWTHDLGVLLDMAVKVQPLWAVIRPGVVLLSRAAVEVRYPGRSMSRKEAREMLKIAKEVRALVRESLGLKA